MSAFTSFTVPDRKPTPENHTFVPRDLRDGVATFVNSSGVPIGDEKVTVSLRQLNNGNYRCRIVVAMPVVVTETINGVDRPVVSRTAYADLNVTFDASSTEQERADTIGILTGVIKHNTDVVNDTLVGLQGIF